MGSPGVKGNKSVLLVWASPGNEKAVVLVHIEEVSSTTDF